MNDRPMRVLHLSTFCAMGGAAIAARRLHEGLRTLGIDSAMLVQDRRDGDDYMREPASRVSRQVTPWRPLLEFLPLMLYRQRRVIHWSTACVPTRKARDVRRQAPDVVHAHWTNRGFVTPEDMARMPHPVVWSLHDSWAFTGGCHIPLDCERYRMRCGRCPQLRGGCEYDLSRMLLRRKARAWRDWPVTIITPSRWLGEAARRSTLLGNMRIETLPNGLDTAQFAPVRTEVARELLGLAPDRRYVLCVAFNVADDRNKGFATLTEAMRRLAARPDGRSLSLLVAGQAQPAHGPDMGLPVHYLGVLHGSLNLRVAYSAADAFVLPSMQENLPNTVMESMSCGCPPVGFRVGGIPELIDDRVNGRLAAAGDAHDLAESIHWVLADETRRLALGAAGRARVESEFALPRVAARHAALYAELLAQAHA